MVPQQFVCPGGGRAQAMEDGPVDGKSAKDLGSAQHRMESSRRPLGRSVLFYDALLATANQVYLERKGGDKVGRCCKLFMEFAGDESYLQTAMLADATDEHMGLLRPTDSERSEKEKLLMRVEQFITRVEYLFDHGACFECGYTRFALGQLRKTRMVFIDGVAKSIGGKNRPRPDVKTRCLGRMKNWVFLCKVTVQAEFPDVDAMLSLRLLQLDDKDERLWSIDVDGPGGSHKGPRSCFEKLLQKLAQLSQEDPEKLRVDFHKYLPAAKKNYRELKMTCFGSWKKAIDDHRTSLGKNFVAPCALIGAVSRLTWSDSTSGVEQTFAKIIFTTPSSRSALSPGLANDEITLITSDPKDDELAIKHARRLWAILYGSSRDKDRADRIDLGRKRGPVRLGKTEISFLRKRRHETDLAVEKMHKKQRTNGRQTDSAHPECWSERHEKEALFQLAKEQKRVLDALLTGDVSIDTVTPDMAELLVGYAKKKFANDKIYYDTKGRQALATAKPNKVSLKGLHVYLDLPQTVEKSQLGIKMRKDGMLLNGDRVGADVVVVERLDRIGLLNTWYSTLAGAFLCTPEYVESLGKRGPSMKLKAAVKVVRFCWVSPRFREAHHSIYALILACSQLDVSSWTMIQNKDVFLEKTKRANKINQKTKALAFVSKEEQAQEDFRSDTRLVEDSLSIKCLYPKFGCVHESPAPSVIHEHTEFCVQIFYWQTNLHQP